MLSYSKRLLFSILILLSTISFSQSKKTLQLKKGQIEKDIKYTNKLLQKTKKNKEKSLNYLSTLNKQLGNRDELLQMLNIEIELITKQIQKIKIKALQNQQLIKEKQEECSIWWSDYKNELQEMIKIKITK